MYNVSTGTLKVGQDVQYKACALSLKAAEIFRSINESSPPSPPFAIVFDFPFSFRDILASFCSRSISNTALES